jgi:hypothetical protein
MFCSPTPGSFLKNKIEGILPIDAWQEIRWPLGWQLVKEYGDSYYGEFELTILV